MGTAAALVQPLFITVDPERDTPSVLANYVSSFHAATGSAQAIRSAALAYKVFFAKSATVGPDGYAIDHTGFIYLVGKDGCYIDFLPPGLAPERIVDFGSISIARGRARPGFGNLLNRGTCPTAKSIVGAVEGDAVAGNGLLDRTSVSQRGAECIGGALPSKAGSCRSSRG